MGDAREGSRKIDGGVLVGHDNVFQATGWVTVFQASTSYGVKELTACGS